MGLCAQGARGRGQEGVCLCSGGGGSCGSVQRGRKLEEGGSAQWDLEELGASPRRAEAAWGGSATVTKSSGGRVQRPGRRARAGPLPGRGRRAGELRGVGRRGRARPLRRHRRQARWAPPTTSHVFSANPPLAQARGARAVGSGVRREKARWGGLGSGHRARARPGQADASRATAGGRAARGGACREGRGLLLGLAQETGRRGGPKAACLGCLFTPGGGALTRRAGGREGKRGLDSRAAATGGAEEAGRRGLQRGCLGRCVSGRSQLKTPWIVVFVGCFVCVFLIS